MVEQRSPKPRVVSSSLATPATGLGFMKFEDVENIRIRYKEKIVKSFLISMGVSALVALIIFLAVSRVHLSIIAMVPAILMPLFFAIVISAIVVTLTTRKDAEAYRKTYKAYFVEQNLSRTFTDLKYNHDAGLDKQILRNTEMIHTGDRYSSNDLTMGKYKDVEFTQADVHIQERYEDKDGNTHYATIFLGRFMIFEFPKKFSFRLEVVSKFFGAKKVPGKNPQTGRKFEKFEVESPNFNKKFKIYAEDGFETFYLLDPAFIERIEMLGDAYQKKMLLGFIDNKLYVGLDERKDSFEAPSPFKPIDEQAELEKVHKDIKVITDFVNELRLDRKIFS